MFSFIEKANAEIDEWHDDSDDVDRNTIKATSPFTKEFLAIQNQIHMESVNDLPPNDLFNLDFIKFLQDNFMPYIFIWAGFVFRGLEMKDKYGRTITHVTSGAIEKQFGTIKISNGHTGLYPAEYAQTSVASVLASCHASDSIIKRKKIESTLTSNFSMIF